MVASSTSLNLYCTRFPISKKPLLYELAMAIINTAKSPNITDNVFTWIILNLIYDIPITSDYLFVIQTSDGAEYLQMLLNPLFGILGHRMLRWERVGDVGAEGRPRKWQASRRSFGRRARRCHSCSNILSIESFYHIKSSCLFAFSFCIWRLMWNWVWSVASWFKLNLSCCNCKRKVHYSYVNVMSLHYTLANCHTNIVRTCIVSWFPCLFSWLQGDRLDEARKVWSLISQLLQHHRMSQEKPKPNRHCKEHRQRSLKRVELLITTNVCEYRLLATAVDWSIAG